MCDIDARLKVMGAALGAAAGLVWAVFVIFTEAFVMTQLWRWFAVPLGVPAIAMAHAIGLNALVAVFVWRFIPTDASHVWIRMREWLALVVTALLIGFIASRFM